MRIICLDIGEKRIGIAVSDPLGITAQGAGVLTRKNIEDDINGIKGYVDEYKADSMVVGMPFNLDGTKAKSAQKVTEFVEALSSFLKIPIATYDERLSTKESEKFLISSDVSRKKRKRVIDIIAAQLILQSYLDGLKKNV